MCKYSFHSSKKPGFDAFLKGMGGNNIMGGSFNYDRFSSPRHADYDAMKMDWMKVGGDIQRALDSFSKKHNLKVNGAK